MKKLKIKDIDQDKFSEKMNAESDRSCAILGVALLDAKLEDLFRKRLCKFHEELLNGTEPISTFSAKIRIANALKWIADPVQKDLDIIRNIRNDFAHSLDHDLSFQIQSIQNRCKELCVAEHYLNGYDAAIDAPGQNLSKCIIVGIKDKFSTPRWRFQLTVDFVSQYLDNLQEQKYVFEHQDSDLLKEVYDLSAGARGEISGTATVGLLK